MPSVFSNNSATLITSFQAHIGSSTAADHRSLELEADSVLLTQFEEVDEYYNNHIAMRQRMLLSRYPGIQSEATRIRHIIKGIPVSHTLKRLCESLLVSHLPLSYLCDRVPGPISLLRLTTHSPPSPPFFDTLIHPLHPPHL